MTLHQRFAGCDISKTHLDLEIIEGASSVLRKRFDNSSQGIDAVLTQLREHGVHLIVYEPSGGYERGLAVALRESCLPARRINARQIRNFAKSLGLLAKTDKVDAMVLARYAVQIQPQARACVSETIHRLQALVRRRVQLVDHRKREKQHLSTACYDDVKASIKEAITHLGAQIDAIEIEIQDLIDSDEALAQRAQIIRSVKGLGLVSTMTLLAEMPELGGD